MLNVICAAIVAASITTFISMKCCIYTAIITFLLLSSLGLSPIYCVGEVNGSDVNHAWVRVGSHNIEQSTLNITHSDAVDYDEPWITFNTTSEFVDRMDMLHPFRSVM